MIGLSSILNTKKFSQPWTLCLESTGYISTSTLEAPTAKFAGCMHANNSIKSTVTSDIITRLARLSHGHA